MEPGEIGMWFERMAPGLVLYARQMVGGGGARAGAEDVVQEAFVKLAGEGRTPANVKGWLIVTVRRGALDALKMENRRGARERKAGLARGMFEAGREALPAAEVEAALAGLALEEREVVTLRIWNDATFEEIAGATGMAVSTVHYRYRSALETLRARWELPCRKK